MSARKKIVCLGFMGACPIAGVIWQQLHYLVALGRLGHEVHYVEDSGNYPYNPATGEHGDYSFAVNMLRELGARYGFSWGYCARYRDDLPTAGKSLAELRALYRDADAILNICGSHALHEDLARSDRLVYVESDPGVEQIRVDNDGGETLAFLRQHRYLFTFGERVGSPEFPVPLHGLEWMPTRQPVVLDFWHDPSVAPGPRFTSIANWSTEGRKDVTWRGEVYRWSKTHAFLAFQEAPHLAGETFELATDVTDEATQARLERKGWRFASPEPLSNSLALYRQYVLASKGEFTVAKDQYVRLATGWFSDRSACYLASGRPVITQETGFSRIVPTGRGLFAFRDLEDIRGAVHAINADYALHSRAALDIAREYFDAEKVVGELLARIDL